jgi:hypothetical protein
MELLYLLPIDAGVPQVLVFLYIFRKNFVYFRLRHLAGVGIFVSEVLMRPEIDAGCSAIEEEEEGDEDDDDDDDDLSNSCVYISLLTRS